MTATNPFDSTLGACQIWVGGDPKPQGSKRHLGRGILVESADVRPWRERIERAVRASRWRSTGAVTVGLTVHLRRPKTTKYPQVPAGPPDLDKLARAVLDAVEAAGAVENDARVVAFTHLAKQWAAVTTGPGVLIVLQEWVP